MHDPQTKMSLAQARQIALTHGMHSFTYSVTHSLTQSLSHSLTHSLTHSLIGVVDVIYKSQALFKDNELIQECTKIILEQLLVDWS